MTVWPVALGTRRGKDIIQRARGNFGNSVTGSRPVADFPGQEFGGKVSVRIERYDQLLGGRRHVALLKLDAQGSECDVVRGMGRSMDDIIVIKTEVAARWLEAHDDCSGDILFGIFHAQRRVVFSSSTGKVMDTPSTEQLYEIVVWKPREQQPRDLTVAGKALVIVTAAVILLTRAASLWCPSSRTKAKSIVVALFLATPLYIASMTSLLPNVGDETGFARRLRHHQDRPVELARVNIFERFASQNAWRSRETVSGPGSELARTVSARHCLGRWIAQYGWRSVGDICGDGNWQGNITGIDSIAYTGYDIANFSLRRARHKNHGHATMRFKQMDLVDTVPPTADAFIVRDVIQHLPLRMGMQVLQNVVRSKAQFLVVSSFPNVKLNIGVQIGGFYRNNIYAPPFDTLELQQPVATCDNRDRVRPYDVEGTDDNDGSKLFLIPLPG